ncbi:MAG: alpha-amylase family glycosyl hydrolase [Bacteroidales bacterium]
MSQAINIYQVFTRLFLNDNSTNKPFGTIEENGCSKFEHFTPKALQALKDFGVSHIWFTGAIRHATCTDYSKYNIPNNNPLIVKGRAGSPYAITDYYDVDPDLATEPKNRMEEFEGLVDRCHAEGLNVIIDFVPNHVAREYDSLMQPSNIDALGENDEPNHAFLPSNNFYYIPNQPFKVPKGIGFPYTTGANEYIESPAKATGNDAFTAQPSITDWYETIKLNYGVDYLNNHQEHFSPIPDTWGKMLHIMQFWAQKGVDGLRCDMAEMVPIEFWQWAIPKVKETNKQLLFIAEVYKPSEYKRFLDAGFDYLYDKVGLYDISRALIEGHGSARQITSLWQQYEGYSHQMLRFLENHDEQRIASSHFAGDPWKAMPAMVLAATLNCGPLMLYFGQEIGEKAQNSEGFSQNEGRTTIFDYWCLTEYQKWVNGGKFNTEQLSSNQRKLRNFYKDLNRLRIKSKAISEGEFYDLMWKNPSLNLDKIYAYLRYYKQEVILVVLNFDNENDHTIKLRIPSDAVNMAGLSKTNKWNASQLIFGNQMTEFYPNDAQNEGISVYIPKNKGLVFKIEK